VTALVPANWRDWGWVVLLLRRATRTGLTRKELVVLVDAPSARVWLVPEMNLLASSFLSATWLRVPLAVYGPDASLRALRWCWKCTPSKIGAASALMSWSRRATAVAVCIATAGSPRALLLPVLDHLL